MSPKKRDPKKRAPRAQEEPFERERPQEPEDVEIRTEDGVALRATVREPVGDDRGTMILAHAMFARRSEFERPHGDGLAQRMSALGWRTLAFDFRGHGESEISRPWSYDDLVRFDVPAIVACARARSTRGHVVLLGHSLGGHVALASHGIGATKIDAFILAAVNVWLPSVEPSPVRAIAKRIIARGLDAILPRIERFPARRLRLGSDDESALYMQSISRPMRTGAWTNDDGTVDYFASLDRVTCPVHSIVTDGDRLNCHPEAGDRFARACKGEVDVLRVTSGDDGGPAPGHMDLVTSTRARTAFDEADAWIKEKLPARAVNRPPSKSPRRNARARARS